MSLNNYIKVTALSMMCLLGSLPSAMAQFPTLDMSAIGTKAKSITQQVQQYKTQIMESKTVGSINSAIGDAKSSMSKFSTDKIAEAKKKAEKAKKQADKIKKIKEDAEKAKKAYEEKKKQFEEYKQKVNEAKQKVAEVKDKVNEAKEMVNDAKDVASSAGALAKTAVADAKNTVAAKAGVSLPSSSSSSKSSPSSVSPSEKGVATAATSVSLNDTVQPVSVPTAATTPAVDVTNAMPNSTFAVSASPVLLDDGRGLTSNRKAFSTVEVSADNVEADNIRAIKETAATDGVPAAAAKLNKVLNTAVQKGDAATLNAVANIDTADIVNSQSKIYEPVKNTPQLSDKMTIKATSGNTLKGTLAPATSNGLQINRRTFKRLDKESSLWLKPDFFSQSHSAELSYTQTMSFATEAGSCDYNNEIVSGDDGSIVILSPTLAKYCCIKAENLTDPNVIKDCANKLLKEMNDEDSTKSADAQGVYATIMAEQGSYGVAEALDNTNVSSSYQADVLKKFTEDLKNASTSNDAINVVSMTNTQILYLLNRMRRIYTAAAVTSGLSGIGGVKAQTLNEDTDIGIGDVGDKYENSVSLSEIEYPVIPENMAKKCTIKVSEGTDGVKDCYLEAVKGKYAEDFKDAEVASNYIENLKYQNTLDTLSKSLYHKVTTAKYDEQLDKTKETSADATTIRTQADGLFNTDYEIQVVLEDIVKLLANRIAYTAVDNMSKLEMPETSNATKG